MGINKQPFMTLLIWVEVKKIIKVINRRTDDKNHDKSAATLFLSLMANQEFSEVNALADLVCFSIRTG